MVGARLRRPERRQQLLTVARAVLAEKGYHDTTMADIAEAAGVTKPVLYQHFDSKHALYETLLRDIGAELERRVVAAALSGDDPRRRVVDGMTAFVDFVEAEQDGFRLIFNGANRTDDTWASIVSEVESSLSEAIAELIDVSAVPVERRRIIARGIIGMAESTVRYAWLEADLGTPKRVLVEDLISMIWGGLRSVGVSRPGS